MHNPVDSSSAPKLVLYSYWQSSCSWRVRFALNLKGLLFFPLYIEALLNLHLACRVQKIKSPSLCPVLVNGDVIVSDSYAILLYLEEKFPQNALLPTDPKLRAVNLQVRS
ncbi:hypothetical protein DH2020_045683 [Rehmannia glutinosa]|uniref:GST N-terminal domain-containing protein n=1 Tax=Rehmannia glutinosa TaxID=99300 RepID=A0ABR0UE59_REHGL